ncbi:terpenoid cyclases/Protein prenyltransferases superfamily protein [Actinidia rufa]|uniref:Terpenoid cyclases/Protein prenyltransferases superfamily protein n=1 Tax=Actinidia rufa TaxID=165716 RepID=A0A7J0D7X3_9ERIC|nr:terpenoid cyclases/Protein prenyltransferases superfamily protein [Actinidia rufa]
MEQEQLHQLKQKVIKLLVAAADKPSQMLNLIDGIQRLGVSYHFTTEIEAALKHIYETCDHGHFDDLYTVALFFKAILMISTLLLSFVGYSDNKDFLSLVCNSRSSPLAIQLETGNREVFNKFKNKQEKFQECLIGDVVGILSLYEATHLRVRGEEILDEALTFTTTHLESMVPNLSNPIAEHVVHALNQPIHKGLTRLDARRYISFYEQNDSHNKDLLNFAKLDFNLLQKLHQRELSEITRWWKDLDFAKKLPFVRDRLVECYFWILGVYFEPQYWPARRILTKVIAMTSIIDDIYDAYGTLEELALFTDAIERWEISALDQLPEYMKLCYQSLLDVYSMIDEGMAKQGGSYRVDYAKSEEWESWPPKRLFDWVSSFPLIVEAASVINRLTDDIVGHKFEQQRGHIVSAVQCYMKQHGATEEEAVTELYEQVTNAWKDINAECLYSTKVPMPLLVRVLNLARVINVLYKDEDGYTHSGTRTKNFVTSVLIDSVPIN